MLTSKQEKEILNFIREQRNEIDQIAEFMYNNCESVCDFASARDVALCRTIGVNIEGKAAVIIGELNRIYRRMAELKGEPFELKMTRGKNLVEL